MTVYYFISNNAAGFLENPYFYETLGEATARLLLISKFKPGQMIFKITVEAVNNRLLVPGAGEVATNV